MNYERNKEFVKRYAEDVIIDLKEMMIELMNEKVIEYLSFDESMLRIRYGCKNSNQLMWINVCTIKQETDRYSKQELTDIFFDHVSKTEFNRFCEILNIDFNFIYGWYLSFGQSYSPLNSMYHRDYKCFEKMFEMKYRKYFTEERRRLRKIERKKNKQNI